MPPCASPTSATSATCVDALRHPKDAADRARAARVIQAMLRSQGVHPLVPRAVLQAILPGLVSVARRLSWGAGGDWNGGGAFFVDLLTTAWEVVVEWAGDDRDYAVLDLLSAIRCRLRRQRLSQRAGHETRRARSRRRCRRPGSLAQRRLRPRRAGPGRSTSLPGMASIRSMPPSSMATASSG